MDLHINEIGFNIIENNPNILSLLTSSQSNFQQQGMKQLLLKICESLSNGEMLIFSNPNDPLPDNNPNNNLIPSNSCQCIN